MPLSPADFYYYSQATGAPLADTPEKRAQQTPEVYRYRQQELQAPKKGPSALDVLGVGAALAGVAAGGYGLARALSRRAPTEIKVTAPSRPFAQATAAEAADLRRAAAGAAEPPPSRTPTPQPSVARVVEPDPWEGTTAARQRSAEEFVRQAREERPQGLVITKLLPTAEPEYVSPYAKGPTYRDVYPSRFEVAKVSPEALEARRQASAQNLAQAAQRRQMPYQLEISEVAPTLQALRSREPLPVTTQAEAQSLGLLNLPAEFPLDPETNKPFSYVKTSVPLSAAPEQKNLFDYLAQSGRMGTAVETQPAATQNVSTRLKNAGVISLSGAPEHMGGEGINLSIPSKNPTLAAQGHTIELPIQHPEVQQFLSQAGIEQHEVIDYWTNKIQGSMSLVDEQNANIPNVSYQSVNAAEPAEDQMTGRVKQQLQRNEDLDMSQVELMEEIANHQYRVGMEQDEPINRVASQLPDGPPVDQAEGTRSLSSQELADIAKSEMMSRRQELIERGLRPGTTRYERALAEGWTSQAGARPGTKVFTESISLPTTIRKAVDVVSASEPLPERSVLNVGPQAVVTQTAAGTAIRGASPSYHEAAPKVALRQTFGTPDVLVRGAPDELYPDIPGALRVRGGPAPLIEEGGPGLSKQEIITSALDIPGLIQKEPVGGSAGIGIYGVEPGYVPGAMSKTTGEYSAAASRRPTDVPSWIQKQERGQFSGVSDEGLMRALEKSGPSGQRAIQAELQNRQTTRESLALSEMIRRANIEGVNPQQNLKQYMTRLQRGI